MADKSGTASFDHFTDAGYVTACAVPPCRIIKVIECEPLETGLAKASVVAPIKVKSKTFADNKSSDTEPVTTALVISPSEYALNTPPTLGIASNAFFSATDILVSVSADVLASPSTIVFSLVLYSPDTA
jgi:hypothetical protein